MLMLQITLGHYRVPLRCRQGLTMAHGYTGGKLNWLWQAARIHACTPQLPRGMQCV